MTTYLDASVVELRGPRQVAVRRERLDLSQIGDRELAARTAYSAISPGTEVAAFAGLPPLRPGQAYPRLVGYCNVAEVVAVGDSVSRCQIGDHILTFQSHRSAFVCPEEKVVVRIPEGVDLAQAATTYLFHLGYNALLKGELRPGHNVAVVGLGTLGLATVALASLFGANVYGLSDRAASLDLASEFGATESLAKGAPNLAEHILRRTGGTGIDLVVTTSNEWEDWRLAISLPRKEGKVCVLGFPGRGQPGPAFNPLDSQFFYDRQLSLIACGYSPDYDLAAHDIRFTISRNCAFLLELIAEKKLPAARLISAIRTWDEIASVYQAMTARSPAFLTCVLKWR